MTGITLRFMACKTCGAVVSVEIDGKPNLDNAELHIAWHRQYGEYVGPLIGELS